MQHNVRCKTELNKIFHKVCFSLSSFKTAGMFASSFLSSLAKGSSVYVHVCVCAKHNWECVVLYMV